MDSDENEIRLLIEDGWYQAESIPGSVRKHWSKVTKPQTEHSSLLKQSDSQWLLTTVYIRIGQRSRIFPTLEAALEYVRNATTGTPPSDAEERNKVVFRPVRF